MPRPERRGGAVLVVGGTGFIGAHVLVRLRARGVPARCLVRSRYAAEWLEARGIEPVRGDITDPASLSGALAGIGTVLNLTTIIRERRTGDFRRVLYEGVRNLLVASSAAGVHTVIQLGALGDETARRDPLRPYLYWKEKGCALVERSELDTTIIESSIVFGPGDQHFTAIALALKWLPWFFMPGGQAPTTVFQPIHVDDLVACVLRALDERRGMPRRVSVGGRERLSYEGIVDTIGSILGRTRRIVRVRPRVARGALRAIGSVMRYEPVTECLMDLVGCDSVAEPNRISDVFAVEPVSLRDRAQYLQAVGVPELMAWVRKRPRHGVFHDHPAALPALGGPTGPAACAPREAGSP